MRPWTPACSQVGYGDYYPSTLGTQLLFMGLMLIFLTGETHCDLQAACQGCILFQARGDAWETSTHSAAGSPEMPRWQWHQCGHVLQPCGKALCSAAPYCTEIPSPCTLSTRVHWILTHHHHHLLPLAVLPYQTSALVEAFANSSAYQRAKYSGKRASGHVVITGHFTASSVATFLQELFHSDHSCALKQAVLLGQGPPCRELRTLLASIDYRSRAVYVQGSPLDDVVGGGAASQAGLACAQCAALARGRAAAWAHGTAGDLCCHLQRRKALAGGTASWAPKLRWPFSPGGPSLCFSLPVPCHCPAPCTQLLLLLMALPAATHSGPEALQGAQRRGGLHPVQQAQQQPC